MTAQAQFRPHHERIEDVVFRRGVDLLDAGDEAGLREHLETASGACKWRQQVVFEGNYFRNPTLLEFVAENPIRYGTLPGNIVAIAETILDAGAERAALNETLMLVCSGCVARECHVQVPLIDLLWDRGDRSERRQMHAALVHGEFEAAHALIRRGARVDLPVAAGLGRVEDFVRLLASAVGQGSASSAGAGGAVRAC